MPRTPIDFSKNINYKLVCKDVNILELYVGSTTNFTKRKNGHKSKCNNPNDRSHNYYVYQFIRANGGWKNWVMVLIEEYPCENSLEAIKKEQYWIEKLQATLNSISSFQIQSKQEYNTDYYEENKEKILEQNQKYYEEHKEQIIEQHKEYYQENKEQILEKMKEKTNCICGSVFRKHEIRRHEKTKKHLEFVEKNK